VRARDACLPWVTLTEAVADGLKQHYGLGAPPPAAVSKPRPAVWRWVLLAMATYIVLRPLLGLGHEVTVCGLAWLLHAAVDTGLWEPAVGWFGLDPIYAGAAVRAAGGVQVAGLAVAGPVGEWLHAVAPGAFFGPAHVTPAAGISVVAVPGGPALGRGLAAFGADVVWLTLGLWLARDWRARQAPVDLLGLLIQGQIVVNHLLDATVSVPDLEASGLPFALALALPSSGAWFTAELGQLPEPWRTVVVGGSLMGLGYACAGVLLFVANRVRPPTRSRAASGQRSMLLVGVALAVGTAASPIGTLAVGESNWVGTPLAPAVGQAAPVRNPSGLLREVPQSPPMEVPTRVQIEKGADGGWVYRVNGRARVIRGVGYNPQYAALPAVERSAIYQRDFSAMRQLGINTVEGWFETQFDEVTLDAAARNGIGVFMPFELNHDWDFANPWVQASILDHMSAYVERYKAHPAVRMWAPGNEDLHRMLYPRWVSQENNPAARARADAFAAFLPRLVDRIHEADPDHPVIYRDAEDVYLSRLKAAFRATAVDRPWLVYGANVYSHVRLQQIVSAWPSQWLDGPLILAEFAPGGVGPAERPLGFERDWAIIRSRRDVVLGGLAYTWATNGPEELDRVFGLVDAHGVPSDGALAALSASFIADMALTADTGPPG
jgi:hypothetical protein